MKVTRLCNNFNLQLHFFKVMPESLKEKWGFPFDPYSIQDEFMQKLYECIDTSKIGIFESPTGTVKYSWYAIRFMHY